MQCNLGTVIRGLSQVLVREGLEGIQIETGLSRIG
jgi:hypothetical protein